MSLGQISTWTKLHPSPNPNPEGAVLSRGVLSIAQGRTRSSWWREIGRTAWFMFKFRINQYRQCSHLSPAQHQLQTQHDKNDWCVLG
jgi:hypothetical protein